MARASQGANKRLASIREKIDNLLKSPLVPVGKALKELFEIYNNFEERQGDKTQIIEFISGFLDLLPTKFDERFELDAWIIRSITDKLSQGNLVCSNMIIPIYSKEWAYNQTIMPNIEDGTLHKISLLFIPREENEPIPNLLDYPWLFHEIGHYIVLKDINIFKIEYLQKYKGILSKLKIKSIADRGLAKSKSQNVINEIEHKWQMSRWAQEIAIDALSLWVCGPAYIATFEDHHENTKNPFYIESNHPPVELRTFALIQAAEHLGWSNYLTSLKQKQQSWQNSIPVSIINRYNALRQTELINICQNTTYKYCKGKMIPHLEAKHLDKFRLKIKQNRDITDGIDFIVRAWLIHHEKGYNFYNNWETRMVQNLMDEFKQ